MKLVDANVLLYAVNESAPQHEEARTWLDDALNAREAVAPSWATSPTTPTSLRSRSSTAASS